MARERSGRPSQADSSREDPSHEPGAETNRPLSDPDSVRPRLPRSDGVLHAERVPVAARIEKPLAALLRDLAHHKNMSVGEMLEETLVHTFESV